MIQIAHPHTVGKMALSAVLTIALAACTPVFQPRPAHTGGVNQPATPQATALTVCMVANSASNIVLVYAQEKGIFREQGLDVSLVDVNSGSTAVTALIAGDADLCQVAGTAVVNAAAAGENMAMVGGVINQQIYSLVVRPEIGAPADLIGKAVAVNAGGSSEFVMRRALERLGLQPDRDVTLVSLGTQSERMAAMASGTVVGTLVSVPETARAQTLGYQVLLDSAALNDPYQHTVIASTGAFLADHRTVVAQFMQAVVTALARMKQDRSGTLQIYAKMQEIEPTADAAYLAEAFDVLVMQIIPSRPYPSPAGVQALIDQAIAEHPAAAQLTTDQLIDNSILQEIEDSGFFDKLGGQ